MLRSTHLPPRCPSQNRVPSTRATDSTSQSSSRDNDSQLRPKLHRFPSRDSFFEEQPWWLIGPLTDSEATPNRGSLRRAASDSAAILEMTTVFDSMISSINGEDAVSVGSQSPQCSREIDTDCGFEADYVYGPNSPRQKTRLTQTETSMVSAILESVPQNPLQFLALDSSVCSRVNESDIKCVVPSAADVPDSTKAPKRYSGPRSRVRKLQYIAELERTVNLLQTWRVELAVKAKSLHQERVALSINNKKLKWQLINLHQEKLRKDCEYQSLKNEVEKLKIGYGRHRRSKSASGFEMGNAGADLLMLDMQKLSLGNPILLRQDFRN